MESTVDDNVTQRDRIELYRKDERSITIICDIMDQNIGWVGGNDEEYVESLRSHLERIRENEMLYDITCGFVDGMFDTMLRDKIEFDLTGMEDFNGYGIYIRNGCNGYGISKALTEYLRHWNMDCMNESIIYDVEILDGELGLRYDLFMRNEYSFIHIDMMCLRRV